MRREWRVRFDVLCSWINREKEQRNIGKIDVLTKKIIILFKRDDRLTHSLLRLVECPFRNPPAYKNLKRVIKL